MANMNVYLHFNGTAEAAFNFYKSVFGGEFLGGLQRYRDMPAGEEECQPMEGEEDKVMHVALPVGGNILMGGDVPASMLDSFVIGNNVNISLNTESEQETERLFHALSAGGEVDMPLAKTFWNAYFGMVTDKYGVKWMVNYAYDS